LTSLWVCLQNAICYSFSDLGVRGRRREGKGREGKGREGEKWRDGMMRG